MLLLEHQRLWTRTSGGHSHTQKWELNVAAEQCGSRSCKFVTCGCPPVKLETRSAGQSQSERQHNGLYKPAWVDVQLTLLDTRIGGPARPTSSPDPPTVSSECQGDVSCHTVTRLCERGQLREAVDALTALVETGSRVSTSVLYGVLKRCVGGKNLLVGRRVHDLTIKLGYESNAFLGNHLLRMYASQGLLQEAMNVFTRVAKPDAFMWSSIISAHAKHGQPQQGILLYHEMRRSGVKPDGHVFVAALQACASVGDLESGMQLHSDVLESGVAPDSFVCSSLVDMYAKCGKCEDARKIFDSLATKNVVTWTAMISGYAECGMLEDARRLFDILASRDVVAWNAMIAGYAEHGLGQEALALYATMEQGGRTSANQVTFACLLKACASAGALQQGRQLHARILERGQLEGGMVLGNCLVEMYAKCGKLEEARNVFDSLATRNVVTWTAMISGYGRNNEGRKAVACFEEMLRAGVQPDDTAVTCLLVACSHEGLVDEGRHYFKAMVEQYGLVPTTGHYNCMVDLLGRAGHLDEAQNLLLSCGSKNDPVGLMSLLNACKSHGDIERATRCFDSLVRLEPQHASAYVYMANMYAEAGRWKDVDRIEALRKSAGASKKPAVAGIEVNKQVHTFVVGEKREDVSRKVRTTSVRLKEEGGHVPHTKLVLKPLSEKEKEDELCGHAEKLALAYGLLNTPSGTPLLVTKNLRMCRDCHNSTEIMSRIEKRDIVVRDAYRVHRFEAGSCSCNGRP